MQLTCPCCHVRFPAEAALQDDAGRELLGLLAGLDGALARPLASYLGLFRARTTQLGWDRALRLAHEVLALGAQPEVMQAALVETVNAMDEKRAQAGWKPLGNHNYLRRVLEGVEARLGPLPARSAVEAPAPSVAPRSRTGQALVGLQGMKRGD